ncbi:hypothetical protein EDD86DRAFT_211538 [Gorgonomyces haynaldii]|nr:hypothetical protein EDD86DRAFT_211538 [Gorgonomyces haynaldii]
MIRQLNQLGGDYGIVNATFQINTSAKTLTVVPAVQTTPNNFWFAKYDWQACFDLRGYIGFQFELVAPTGSEISFTLTQKSADCVDRLVDSVYVPLTKYITPNGQKQTVLMPFADFSKNINGGNFDFQHLKDWTAVNFSPADGTSQFVFSNLILKGNCSLPATNSQAAQSSAQTSAAPSAAATKASGAEGIKAGAIAGAIAAGLFAL